MAKRIIYTNDEGGVSIFVPAPNTDCEDVLNKVVPAHLQAGAEIVEDTEINSDRTFRNAWKKNGKKLEVDLPKAAQIAHERRRAKRAEEFAPLDVEATIPAKAKEAESKRQAVRNKHDTIQLEIDAATTPEQLKAVIDREAL